MKKIVITQDLGLYPDQVKRLKKLGDVKMYKSLANTYDDWVKRCEGADIICSGKFGLKQRIYEIKDTFFSLPFAGVGWLDRKKIKKNNLTISSCPGCNKDAVSEWTMAMILNLLREFHKHMNVKKLPKGKIPEPTKGLTGKKIAIIGKGNIGGRIGRLCKAFDMKVKYFKRGDNLLKSIKDADIIINSLSQNPTTKNLLNKKFFNSVKKGAYFISFTSSNIFNTDAMIKALNSGLLAGAAIDAGNIQVGDTYDPYYKKLIRHKKIIATPHIAYNTDVTDIVGNDMMIDNIEAWLNGRPINIVK